MVIPSMTTQEELELLLQIMQKHDLPMSTILEFAVKEKLQACSVDAFETTVAQEPAISEECEKDLPYYKNLFLQLSTVIQNGKKVPHKAILLLGIMNQIADGLIKENKIELNKSIANSFAITWEAYHLGHKAPSVWTPFWYMKSEPFWHFKANGNENVLHNILSFAGHPTIGQMRGVIAYAYLDEELFWLMKEEKSRKMLAQVLVDTYIK